MDLRSYLDTLPPGGITAFAKEVGVERVYLWQLATKQKGRQPSPKLCLVIEQKSGGKVPRRSLRKDWAQIWPDLERRQTARV